MIRRVMSLSGSLGSIMVYGMVIQMNDGQLQTLAHQQIFLDDTTGVDAEVLSERQPQHILERAVRLVGEIILPPALRAFQVEPVRRPVTGAAVARAVHERLGEMHRVPVYPLPLADSIRVMRESKWESRCGTWTPLGLTHE